ncbi:hypothetical protein [Colwellia psychrerythraea]|uniref:Uncharacterized protein n=1 Tax=Colwellia psychrerythraea TaxID=28229 RepID=A0A099KMT1_COLPS|nr:hypothetical protein [Colwellia psychrerythraea]KGJ90963.1 hypothetical protein GAB14E_0627 [Colwellia psychrerythraea]
MLIDSRGKSNKLLEFLSDWGTVLILIYFVSTALLGTSYEHMHNQQYIYTAIYLGPVIGIGIGYLAFYRFQFQTKLSQKLAIISGAVFAWFAICLGTAGLVATINSNLGSQEKHCINGSVIDKWKNSGFIGNSYNLKIKKTKSGDEISLDASATEYNSYNLGASYRVCWIKGSLDLIYRNKKNLLGHP